MIKRWFVDRYNPIKVWEVTKLSSGNYYVKQFINGTQYGKGLRIHKWLIDDIGMMEGKEIEK